MFDKEKNRKTIENALVSAEKEVEGRSLWQDAWERMLGNRAAMVSMFILGFIVIFAIFLPMVSPYNLDSVFMDDGGLPPSFLSSNCADKNGNILPVEQTHEYCLAFEDAGLEKLPKNTYLFGTDDNGRDLFTRVAYGGRISLAVGFLATFVSLIIGVIYGATSGYFGGKVDVIMMSIVDIMYGIPFMFLVILLMTMFGRNFLLIFVALGAVQWLTMARIVRGQTLSIRKKEFVEAAEAMGVKSSSIIFKHVIPNLLGPVIVYITLTVPGVILEESFLSFLGLGIHEPMTSWGVLISEGTVAMENQPWLLVFPALFLSLTLLCFNFIGDGFRDALDPKDR